MGVQPLASAEAGKACGWHQVDFRPLKKEKDVGESRTSVGVKEMEG